MFTAEHNRTQSDCTKILKVAVKQKGTAAWGSDSWVIVFGAKGNVASRRYSRGEHSFARGVPAPVHASSYPEYSTAARRTEERILIVIMVIFDGRGWHERSLQQLLDQKGARRTC